MWFPGLGQDENGYGLEDRVLADDLRKASTREEADRRAREDGLKDADDAVKWLKDRS
jgi:hypothetical protein